MRIKRTELNRYEDMTVMVIFCIVLFRHVFGVPFVILGVQYLLMLFLSAPKTGCWKEADMQIHYPTNVELVDGLEPHEQEFWLKVLDDMDRQEENYQRKMRYHQVSSLDFVVSEDGRETTLQELIPSDSYSGEDNVIKQVEEQLYLEALTELDEKHRIAFESMFVNGLTATETSTIIGRTDKTAKKYCLAACEYVLKKIQS